MSSHGMAADMVTLLRRHYQPDNRPPAGVFAPEIGSPCGRRRADLIWMPTTVSGGPNRLHGHEIKVTRADLLTELADPTKADPWAQYCHRWWLVVAHPNLIDGLDIPETWGVMAPPSGRRTRTMTIVRQAPRLDPVDPSPGIARLAAWQLYAHHDEIEQLRMSESYLRRQIEGLRQEVATAGVSGSPAAAKVARIIHEAEKQLEERPGLWGSNIDEREVVAAVVDHAATREAADRTLRSLRQLVTDVERAVDPFRAALPALQAAKRSGEKAVKSLSQSGGGQR